jgi:phage host-nuclease inhibitor protein Gam
MTLAEDQLDAWLNEDTLELDEGPPADTVQADKLLRARRWVRRQQADVKATVAARKRELDDFAARRNEQFARRVAELEKLLDGWARAEHAASGGKTVTWQLPSGTVKLRPAPDRLEYTGDAEDVAADLVRAGHEALTKTQVLPAGKNEIKARVLDGPVIDGFEGAPEGYTAHYAVLDDGSEQPSEVLPGMVLLVADQKRLDITQGA